MAVTTDFCTVDRQYHLECSQDRQRSAAHQACSMATEDVSSSLVHNIVGTSGRFIRPIHPLAYDLEDVNILSPDDSHFYTPWARKVLFGEIRLLSGNSFGFTSGGQMTLLQLGAKEGDHVCFLYGIQQPPIVRQNSDRYCEVFGAHQVHQPVNWES